MKVALWVVQMVAVKGDSMAAATVWTMAAPQADVMDVKWVEKRAGWKVSLSAGSLGGSTDAQLADS